MPRDHPIARLGLGRRRACDDEPANRRLERRTVESITGIGVATPDADDGLPKVTVNRAKLMAMMTPTMRMIQIAVTGITSQGARQL